MPIVTIAAPYEVTGCPFVPPEGNGPCMSARWSGGSTRVTSEGQPVAITTGLAVCVPTGAPLVVVSSQTRAIAT
jgi:hypothetical protein